MCAKYFIIKYFRFWSFRKKRQYHETWVKELFVEEREMGWKKEKELDRGSPGRAMGVAWGCRGMALVRGYSTSDLRATDAHISASEDHRVQPSLRKYDQGSGSKILWWLHQKKTCGFARTKINSQAKAMWLRDSSLAEEKVQVLPRHSVKNAFWIKLQLKNNLFWVWRGEQLKYWGQKLRMRAKFGLRKC